MKTFTELALSEPIQRALKAEKYNEPTPIQAGAIPFLLEGHDILACAQTGTGKTAAFCLPLLEKLSVDKVVAKKGQARSLILTPTRELAEQIYQNLVTYSQFLDTKCVQIYGGVKQGRQVTKVSKGVDVLVATPGRLLDLISQGYIKLGICETLILDEADRMFDMGFMRDVKKIVALVPKKRQTLLFSATMPKEIERLAVNILKNPKDVRVNPPSSTAELIDDKVCFLEKKKKKDFLIELLNTPPFKKVIVFTRTKHGANRLVTQLGKERIKAGAIHGNKSQGARQKALKEFSSGQLKVLVATDVMARGIDVDKISHVINFDIPVEAESYVHRIGRTARAGQNGEALSFCDEHEVADLLEVEKILKREIEVFDEFEAASEVIAQQFIAARAKKSAPRKPGQRNSRGGGGQGRGSRNKSEGSKGAGRRRSPSKGSSARADSKGTSRPKRSNSKTSKGKSFGARSESSGASSKNKSQRKNFSRQR